MGQPIYLDYNATTPIDPEVIEAMMPYIQTFFGNPSSAYSIGNHNKEVINRARKQVANLINARTEEIVFTSCATESNNMAIHGFVLANKEKGKHIITSVVEHPSVTEVCKHLELSGYDVTWLPVDKFGTVNPGNVDSAIRPDTVLITIMHANNEVGTIQPIREIAAIARKNNITFHTDASQSAGKIDTDVETLGVDLLTIAGHKLYAPKGIGALYIKQDTQIKNLIYGAGQENGIRPGTENVIQIVGLGKACEIAKRDLAANRQNMLSMRDRLWNGLKNNLGNKVKLNSNLENCLPNTLSIAFADIEAHVLASLVGNDLLISTGSACHSGNTEISPVLKAMNLDPSTASGTVRISLGKGITRQEIDIATEILSHAVFKLT